MQNKTSHNLKTTLLYILYMLSILEGKQQIICVFSVSIYTKQMC